MKSVIDNQTPPSPAETETHEQSVIPVKAGIHPEPGIGKKYVTWADFDLLAEQIAFEIATSGWMPSCVYGVPRGGLCLAVRLSHMLGVPLMSRIRKDALVCDDIADTGTVLSKFQRDGVKTAVLIQKKRSKTVPDFLGVMEDSDRWIVFPWECDGIEDPVSRVKPPKP